MSEGTKLGEFNNDTEFNAAIASDSAIQSNATASATKLGEMSSDDQALYNQFVGLDDSIEDGSPADVDSDEETMEALFAQDASGLVVDYQTGDIVKGIVRSVEKGGVLIDIGYKSDGFIPNNELGDTDVSGQPIQVESGQELAVYITKLETKEGYAMLSLKRAVYELSWQFLTDSIEAKTVLSVKVINKVEGGLVAQYNGIRGFIPASQVLEDKSDSLDHYVSRVLDVLVLQVDRRRRKVIFSVKQVKQQPSAEQLDRVAKLMDSLEIGEVREGKVTSIKDFGVFVDIGGIEGLVHISELSWARVNHPSDVVTMGEDIKVFVLGVDKENNRVSLGIKQLHTDPWVNIEERFKLGQLIPGEVSRIMNFGAFVKISDDLEGLIHISEIANRHIEKVEDVLSVGQQLEVRIIKLRPDEQKIGLSLIANEPDVESESSSTEDSVS